MGRSLYMGVARNLFRGEANKRGAAGAEIEAPKASRGRGMGRGYFPPGVWYPPPSRLGGLRERRKLPQRGPGPSPGRKRVLMHFELDRTHLVIRNFIIDNVKLFSCS